jgi:thiamine pyrophosphate-dependent acetolactate synthase large subunit-like protein
MNGAELLVAALENEGVKQIFGVPGEENLDVVEACGARRSSSWRPATNKRRLSWQPHTDG